MKKQLIKEAFRLQQLAGIAPINEISDSNTLNTLGAYEDENGKTVVSDLIKNEKFIEDKLRKAGISSSKEYDQDIHGQKIVIFTIEAEGMSRGMQRELMGQETLNLKAESTGGGTYYISIVSSYGTDNYLQEETFNSYEECLISVIGDGGGDTDDLNPEEHDVEFLEKTLDELIEEHDGEWTVASIIGKNEGKLYVGP
jgi:hypothetical protein